MKVVLLAGGMAIALGAGLIWQLERLPLFNAPSSPESLQPLSTRPAWIVPRRRRVEPQAEHAEHAEHAETERAIA